MVPEPVENQNSSEPSGDQNQNPTPEPIPTDDGVLNRENLDPLAERYLATLEQQLRIQQGQITDLSRKAEELSVPRIVEDVVDPDTARQRFFEDPIGTMTEVIKKELGSQVAPIRDLVDRFGNESKLDTVITTVKSYPQLKDKWDPAIERYIRNSIQQNPNVKVDENLISGFAIQAIGLAGVGMLDGYTSPKPTEPTRTTVTPPIVRPSNPRDMTTPDDKPALRELTEQERALARMRGQTDEQYLKWLSEPASMVTSSKIGITPAKAGA